MTTTLNWDKIQHLPFPEKARHPLAPLTPAEIQFAVALLKHECQLGEGFRFASISLHEPPKEIVYAFQPGDPIQREAFVVAIEKPAGKTYEAVVSISQSRVLSWTWIPGVQPLLLEEEMLLSEQIVKADPRFQAAMHRRGLSLDQVVLEFWSNGHFGVPEEDGQRLMLIVAMRRQDPTDNPYAHPIDGLMITFDLNRMEIFRLEDSEVFPIPEESGSYVREAVPEFRSDLKPLEITQPQGPSFTVEENQVCWQKWQLRVSFTAREGLVLHTIGYEDQGRVRPILFRASLSEMVVPYGDPRLQHYRKNAFDVGEYGLGTHTNSLKLGCDCLGEIYYFDVTLADNEGAPKVLKNAICMHEEDFGILWKHSDWRTGRSEVRRSRRLVISFIATIGNYEYGFFWYFYQDGSIQYEVKLTGIISTAVALPGEIPQYGTLVAPGLNALIHQHFFNVRLDWALDGLGNSLYEINTHTEPLSPNNPYGNAFAATSTLLPTEKGARRSIHPTTARSWKVVNPTVFNRMGQPVAYKIEPGHNTVPFMHPDSSIMKRAGFMSHHLWATPFDPNQYFATGSYPNQNEGGDGLPAWTEADRSIENTDLVTWYTFGHHHICRLEDWPIMPVAYIGFMLKPLGFFDRNPALDVPIPQPKRSCCHP